MKEKKEIAKLDALGAGDIVAQVQRIQQIMDAVMKNEVHYGTIPGTKEKSLWKPGAEKIMLAFRISDTLFVEDLSVPDERRYRVRSVAKHIPTDAVLGEGVGECSSSEEKYKWRKAICDGEFDETPADRRREKWEKGYQGSPPKKIKQIRTNPEDMANTVLKMAKKRALIDMTLTVTAASDVFKQDLEDLPEELREGGEPAAAPMEPKKKEAPKSYPGETAPASTADCSICQKSINPSVERYSRDNFGKPLCFDCQKAEKAKNAAPTV